MTKELDEALVIAKRVPFDVDRDKYVILSDQHIGDGDRGSDDFKKNRDVYLLSLKHYFDHGYNLISLGDSEELWECDFPEVIQYYKNVFDAEKKFLAAGRLHRIYGNHDIFWRNRNFVGQYLEAALPGISVVGSVLLEADAGRIFLAHGHQGECFSDRLWRVSRFVVRAVWKPVQRIFKIPSTGAAKNIKKRDEKEKAFYRWAKQEKVLFIAGHTHRAIFGSRSKIDRLRAEVEEMNRQAALMPPEQHQASMNRIHEKEAALQAYIEREFDRAPETRFEITGDASPCYFNDGCCSYDDGMTAMEIEKGRIRLVKWDRNSKVRTVYEEAGLRELFARIGNPKPA